MLDADEKIRRSVYTLVAVLWLFAPLYLNNYWTDVLNNVALYAVLGLSLNIILGFTEIMSRSPEVYGSFTWPRMLRRDVLEIRRRHFGEESAVLPPEPSGPSGWDEVVRWMENDFEAVVRGRHPPVDRALAALRETGARRVLLSGSGGACFALVSGGEEGARRAARSVARALGWPVRAVRTLERFPPVETDGDDRGLKEGVASG